MQQLSTMQEILDYIFMDTDRIKSYFEQISSSPVAYDKIPIWKASLNMFKVGAEGTQQMNARPFTNSEKIDRILDFLRKGKHFLDGSDSIVDYITLFDRTYDLPETCTPEEISSAKGHIRDRNTIEKHIMKKPFHLIEAQATKIFLPTNSESSSDGIVLWVSSLKSARTKQYNDVALVLLQNSSSSDRAPEGGATIGSPYHQLTSLISRRFLNTANTESRLLLDQEKCHAFISYALDLRYGPDAETQHFLTEMGAEVSLPRKIRSLYRLRDFAYHNDLPEWKYRGIAQLYAYPIFIAAA